MIDSAISIKNNEDIGNLCANYTDSDVRLYHKKNKDEKKHIFTIFCYNRDKKNVEKHQISLSYKFNLEDIREQIKKETISTYLKEYTYLNQLEEPEMTREELKELFDQAYAADRLLTGKTWRQLVIDKIAEDGEVFYKYFSSIKREIRAYDQLDISGLKDEHQICFKCLFGQQNDSIRCEDKQLIVDLYSNTKDGDYRAVLYEILYDLRNIE